MYPDILITIGADKQIRSVSSGNATLDTRTGRLSTDRPDGDIHHYVNSFLVVTSSATTCIYVGDPQTCICHSAMRVNDELLLRLKFDGSFEDLFLGKKQLLPSVERLTHGPMAKIDSYHLFSGADGTTHYRMITGPGDEYFAWSWEEPAAARSIGEATAAAESSEERTLTDVNSD